METTHDAYEFDREERRERHRAKREDCRAQRRERRARRRAARRTDERVRFADQILRYVLVTTLLVVLVRPIGVIVGLVWGFKLVRRAYRFDVEPKLRRRVMRKELRRARRGPEGRAATREERLAERMGDDPDGRDSRDWARGALAELDEAEAPTGRERATRVSDLVDEVVDAFEARADRSGVSFRVDIDAEGRVHADPERLRALLLDLVGESVRALSREGAQGPARIHVEMGENLAGSEVWVRIRDDRAGAGDGARGAWGSRPVAGVAGAMLETQASPDEGVERVLTLQKQPAGLATGRDETERNGERNGPDAA